MDINKFLDELLCEGAGSSYVLNDVNLGDKDYDQYKTLSPLQFNSADQLDTQSNDGIISSEFVHIAPSDAQQNSTAILDIDQQSQNDEAAYDPIPQQAVGNKNGIWYQVHPNVFGFLNGTMYVKQQPKANNRLRYQCDGLRFMPDSRYHPMTINLPDLRSILLGPNQTLGIVMTLVTTANNPMGQTCVHANDIVSDENNTEKIGYGCIFTPLDPHTEILNFEKKYNRISIIYKKCDEYTFDITPFDAITMFGSTEKYTNGKNKKMGNAAKAKDFKRDYELLSYKIVFHLAVKENNVIYISNITCETDVIEETLASQTSVKRSASPTIDEPFEEENSFDSHVSSPSKKFKSSEAPPLGLPVTRVSNETVETNMDWFNDLA